MAFSKSDNWRQRISAVFNKQNLKGIDVSFSKHYDKSSLQIARLEKLLKEEKNEAISSLMKIALLLTSSVMKLKKNRLG